MKQTTAYLFVLLTFGAFTTCRRNDLKGIDFRKEMRQFVIEISRTARAENPDFIVIPQNGIELVSLSEDADGTLALDYLAAIDGHGQESLFYGYNADDQATPIDESDYLIAYLERSQAHDKRILVTDYCATTAKISDSYAKNEQHTFVSFAANSRQLDRIPPTPIHNENADTIDHLSAVRNFLYLINFRQFATKQAFIEGVCATNYDLLICDLFFDEVPFSSDEIAQLRRKANGGRRLVIAYMSIGEAEDYRYYWQSSWGKYPPKWLEAENPDWEGNYKVRYWEGEWQHIILYSYLERIQKANFDGVYLDIIDAFEYFEEKVSN